LREDGVVGPATLAALNVPVGERVRQIEMNLELWRWLPRDLGQRHIMVNITDYTMSVVEDGREVMGSKVIVGKPSRPTPVFAGEMSYLVLNPYWHVPPTIAVKDKLPKLRRNPYALSRQRIRVFAGGKEINPGRVNWRRVNARNLRYHFRQDPGPRNALGRIKFMFPNRYSVYLHDTPSKYLFNRDNRTFSSGCVRVADPIDLAEYLLSDSGWSRKAIVSKTRGKRQRRVNLSEKVPVYILYWTAWVDDAGETHFRRDIYEHDKRLAKAFRSEYKKLGLTLTAS
jgi:murein L,D-transpeptidase YcbB/YkuD